MYSYHTLVLLQQTTEKCNYYAKKITTITNSKSVVAMF